MSDGQCLEVVQAAQLLSEGKPAAAIECLEAINTLDLDGHLLMAEALWTMAGPGGTRESLVHYQAAEAAAGSDISKRAAVALGHGWALMQLKDPSARKKLDLARTLAQQDGNAAAIQFVDGLLNNENADSSDVSSIESTWAAFVAASLGDQQGLNAILFMRGSIKEPEDERSALGVMKLKSAGVKAVKAVNVNESGPDLPGGLQTLSSLAVALPQLYLNGVLVESWLELDEAEFRDLLVRGGAEMNEMEPCHGVFSDGLEDWQIHLVELVSKLGSGDWDSKAKELSSFEAAPKSAEALEQAWEHLAPKVKERLEAQPEMPCGHSCNTCPTKHDCQLHDAVGHVRDIEDLA
ncbi:Uncharacterized protein SCF082_LOCUS40752 [Durusdinium trenchii]|uniref:Uncharacterized protein n=1 Tax=Durusdinium trenchii TaxID=1381693 RepID=A0ABP0QEQ1_9DINO